MSSTAADYVQDSQTALLVVYAADGAVAPTVQAEQVSQAALLVVYSQTINSRYVYNSQFLALTPYAVADVTSPYSSQAALLVVYATGTSVNARSRAWSFVLDGHTFYVLDLGTEGTFLYDIITKQWSSFTTDGYTGWNMHFGTTWGQGRVAGGDALTANVWELVPSAAIDEGFRAITRRATGAIHTNKRMFKAVETFNLNIVLGAVIDPLVGASISLRWSDDNGVTWSPYLAVALDATLTNQEIAWRSLGAFNSPGRVFEVVDTGSRISIEGADAGIDNFDEDGQAPHG